MEDTNRQNEGHKAPGAGDGGNATETIRFKRFVIHELIGVGGMAEVYRGTAEEPDGNKIPIVLKRIKKEHAKNSSFIQMFLDEAKLSARMKHPNIVEVYEYGEYGGINYLSMEFIDGLHLQATHKRYEQVRGALLPWQAIVLIIRDVLRGLGYAHKLVDEDGRPMGLIHRDVNLDNVMISREGKVKLLDFGIVKAREGLRAAETAAGVLKGKFSYMSPEQVAGKALLPSSDVFSTGIVFHELLTGRRLFFGDDDLSILMAVKSGPIPDPRDVRGDLPEEVSSIVLKALERDLDKRYSTAEEMITDLDSLLAKYAIKPELLVHLMGEIMGSAQGSSSKTSTRKLRQTIESWNSMDAVQDDEVKGQGVKGEGGSDAGKADAGKADAGKADAGKADAANADVKNTGGEDRGPRMASGTLGVADTLNASMPFPPGSGAGADSSSPASSTRARKKTAYMWGGRGDPSDNESVGSDAGSIHTAATLYDIPEDQARILQEAGASLDGAGATVVDGKAPDMELAEQETRILEEGDDVSKFADADSGPGRGAAPAGQELTEESTRILEEGDDISKFADADSGPGGGAAPAGQELTEESTRILEDGDESVLGSGSLTSDDGGVDDSNPDDEFNSEPLSADSADSVDEAKTKSSGDKHEEEKTDNEELIERVKRIAAIVLGAISIILVLLYVLKCI